MKVKRENARQIRTMRGNIRMLRRQRNLSVRDLSEQSGISASVLRNIEAGQDFGLSHLLKLCRFYGIKPYEIFLPIDDSADAPPDFTE